MGRWRFVRPGTPEARELVLRELSEELKLYAAGVKSYEDIYFIVISEPELGEEEKELILSSPHPSTVASLLGSGGQLELDGVPLPREAVVAAWSSFEALRLLDRYPFLSPPSPRGPPGPLSVVSAAKALTWVVKGGIRHLFIYRPESWPRGELLAALLAAAKLAGVPVYSTTPLMFETERPEGLSRLLSLGEARTVVLKPEIARPYQAAIRKLLEERPQARSVYESLGLRPEPSRLEYRHDWYIYGADTGGIERAWLRERLERLGLPSAVAAELSRMRLERVPDIRRFYAKAAVYLRPERRRELVELISEATGRRPELIEWILGLSGGRGVEAGAH